MKPLTRPQPTPNVKPQPKTEPIPKNLPNRSPNDILRNESINDKKPSVKTPPKSYEDDNVDKDLIETDYVNDPSENGKQNDKLQMVNNKESSNGILIFAIVGSIALITSLTIALFVFRRYKLGSFRNYGGSKRSDSMSDVRFLASDEALDFTLRTSD